MIILGQLHHVKGIEKFPTQQSTVDQSQRRILDCLISLKVKDVYLEGLAEGHDEITPEVMKLVKKIFPRYEPAMRLTEEQRKFLSRGAAVVYAGLFDDVVLHASTSKTTDFYVRSDMVPCEFQEKYDRRDSSESSESVSGEFTPLMRGWSRAQQKFLLEGREDEMAKYIQRDLQGHPRAVALVVGLGHQFNTALKRPGFCPPVYRKDFG